MLSFSQLSLNPYIAKALDACGYNEPTPIQARAIPSILQGKDMVASAQTGTGKTAAFVLPALHRLAETKGGSKPRVLILTPTRELATQIMDAVSKYGKFMRLNLVSLVGGMPYRQQLKGLSRPVDIIVATPGRLLDHMQEGRVKLSDIEMLILDEADRMLDMGFIDDVKQIAKATPETRQTLLFSATVDGKLDKVVKQLLKDPMRIEVKQEKMSPIKIKQEVYMADNVQHKTKLLQHFIKDGNIFKAIIFSATKVNADRLTKQLHGEGHSVAALHGDLKQNVRNRTLEAMRRGKIQFLIATDVAARGIDINDITHVINFDLPKFHEDYVHRIGRTGRAGRSGTAISFALPEDGRNLQGIERYIGEKIEFSTVSGLEASKSLSFGGGAKKGRGRGAGGGGGRSSFKSGGFKGGASSKKEGFRGDGAGRSGGGFKGDRSEGGRSSFRGESGRSEGGRSSFKGEGARSEGGRSSFKGDGARSEGGRSSFRSEGARSEGGRSSSRGESGRSEGGRSSFRSEGARSEGGRSSFRSEGARSEGARGSFRSEGARSEGGRSSFRADGARNEGGRSSFRSDGARSEGGRSSFRSEGGRSEGGRSSFRSEGARSEGGRSSFRTDGARGEGAKSGGFKGRSEGSRSGGFRGDTNRTTSFRADSPKREGGRSSFKSESAGRGDFKAKRGDGFKSGKSRKEFTERN